MLTTLICWKLIIIYVMLIMNQCYVEVCKKKKLLTDNAIYDRSTELGV